MEQKKIWDYFQTDPLGRKMFEGAMPRYHALSREVLSDDRVLNIGVGAGGIEKILYKRKRIKIFSLDPSESAVALLKDNFSMGEQAKVGISKDIPWEDNFFDVVIMSEVIEHLDMSDYKQTLVEVFRVLRPGGKFVFTVPAEEDLSKNDAICPCCGAQFHRWGHVQSFNANSIQDDISSIFCDIQLSRRSFSDWRLLNWKGQLVWLIKRLLSIVGIKGSAETFFVVAKKSQ